MAVRRRLGAPAVVLALGLSAGAAAIAVVDKRKKSVSATHHKQHKVEKVTTLLQTAMKSGTKAAAKTGAKAEATTNTKTTPVVPNPGQPSQIPDLSAYGQQAMYPTVVPPPPPTLVASRDYQPMDTFIGNKIKSQFVQAPALTPPPTQTALDLAFGCPVFALKDKVAVQAPSGCSLTQRTGQWSEIEQAATPTNALAGGGGVAEESAPRVRSRRRFHDSGIAQSQVIVRLA